MTLEEEVQEILLSEYGPHFRTRDVAKRLIEFFEKLKPVKAKGKGVPSAGVRVLEGDAS